MLRRGIQELDEHAVCFQDEGFTADKQVLGVREIMVVVLSHLLCLVPWCLDDTCQDDTCQEMDTSISSGSGVASLG